MEDQVETGWLIEMTATSIPMWWAAHSCGEGAWTNDSNKAVRFSREQDAMAVIKYNNLMANATEHQWG